VSRRKKPLRDRAIHEVYLTRLDAVRNRWVVMTEGETALVSLALCRSGRLRSTWLDFRALFAELS
jgi:hypothetical protein